MSDQQDILIRDARDRLIDLLRFGETYPLRDLPILDDQLTVPFDRLAKIPIDKSQLGVRYQLFDRNDVPVQSSIDNKPIEAQGTGRLLFMESPKIQKDITYKVLAQKNNAGHQAYLHETATIKVGLDIGLAAFIVDTPCLEPGLDHIHEEDARIVDYGTAATVTLKKSQEGVDYCLVSVNGKTESILSEQDVRGTYNNIELSTRVFYEDTDIRIRATKIFDVSEKRKTQSALLDIVLPLKVRASTALQVAIAPTPIIDYKASTTLKIEASQQSARYQVFSRKISDADFIFDEGDGLTRVSVKRSDDGIVQVSIPPQQHLWHLPEGFTPLGEAQSGTGGVLSFPVEVLTEDTLLIVQAEKEHQGHSLASSAMRLAQAAAVLLRPDPDAALELRVTVTSTDTKRVDTVEVLGGQSGVFYHLRKKISGPDLARPAYFHQKDETDPAQNKGIGQFRIEDDFVVPRSIPAQNKGIGQFRIGGDFFIPRSIPEKTNETDPALIFPASAILDGDDMMLGTSLEIPGIKALTKISLKTPLRANLSKLPSMAFDESAVDVGDTARLVISRSLFGERYQFFLNGAEVKRARNGNGSDLVFITETVTEDSTFEVWVTQPHSPHRIKVTRIVPLEVKVNE